MITALLVDDDKHLRTGLKALLDRYTNDIAIIGEAESVKTGIEAIEKLQPQVIFLDIHLSDGTGFDILEKIAQKHGKINAHIVFITAHEEYAVKAFRFSALDFLLKPVDFEELQNTIAKIKAATGKNNSFEHIALLLENEPGALSRVVGLFSARGYNIESLTVATTEDPSLSRMTIVTTGSDDVIEQITKHLNRLIEVVKVVDLSEGPYTERELMLIKVRAVGKEREEMKRMADIFRGRIIDVTDKTYTIELTGDAAKLDAFIEAIDRAAILETVRTGTSGIGRGERILRV